MRQQMRTAISGVVSLVSPASLAPDRRHTFTAALRPAANGQPTHRHHHARALEKGNNLSNENTI